MNVDVDVDENMCVIDCDPLSLQGISRIVSRHFSTFRLNSRFYLISFVSFRFVSKLVANPCKLLQFPIRSVLGLALSLQKTKSSKDYRERDA